MASHGGWCFSSHAAGTRHKPDRTWGIACLGAGKEGAGEASSDGTVGFAALCLALLVLLPSLGPRVPSFYHRTDALLAEIRASSGVHQGVEVVVEEFVDPLHTGGVLHVVTARPQGPATTRARLLVVANEHAREMVTGEVALGLVQRLAGTDVRDGSCCGRGSSGARLRALLDSGMEISVVPVANVEGRRLAEGLRPCQRGTADVPLLATDLNRQFPTDWAPGVQFNFLNASLDTHGMGPFSAYQARILRAVAESRSWAAFVDLHSGALSLNFPFGHREGGNPKQAEQLRSLKSVRALCPQCLVGPTREVMRYDNPGQMADWMYEDRGVTYSFVWEVYRSSGLCASHFNPTDKAELAAVVERWCCAVAALGEYVLQHAE